MTRRVLEGQVVALVGAGGPSAGLARALATSGVDVHATVRGVEPAQLVVAEPSPGGRLTAYDGATPEQLLSGTDRLDGFIFVAAPAVISPYIQLSEGEWARGVLDPLADVHRWTVAALARMRRQRRGTIVLVGPAAGGEPDDRRVAPAVMAGALSGLAKGLAFAGLTAGVEAFALTVGARAVEVGAGTSTGWVDHELAPLVRDLLTGRSDLAAGDSRVVGESEV